MKKMQKSYGNKVSLGSDEYPRNIIPTGSLSLDVTLGLGGWPGRSYVGIYGPRDVGKSALALNAVANCQAQGQNAVWIALEPGFDENWAIKHGVDVANLPIPRPDDGKEAFDMLYDCVIDGSVNLVIFDSIGALLNPSETGDDANARAGGQAGLITWGVKRSLMPTWRNNVCVIFLNQARAVMSSPYASVSQPGGYALEHHEDIIVQLKNSSAAAAQVKVKSEEGEVQIGQQVTAVVNRNKLNEGSRHSCTYWFYNKEVYGYPFGIDKTLDTLTAAKKVGVIVQSPGGSKGTKFELPDGVVVYQMDELREYLETHPDMVKRIREEVIAKIAA